MQKIKMATETVTLATTLHTRRTYLCKPKQTSTARGKGHRNNNDNTGTIISTSKSGFLRKYNLAWQTICRRHAAMYYGCMYLQYQFMTDDPTGGQQETSRTPRVCQQYILCTSAVTVPAEPNETTVEVWWWCMYSNCCGQATSGLPPDQPPLSADIRYNLVKLRTIYIHATALCTDHDKTHKQRGHVNTLKQ